MHVCNFIATQIRDKHCKYCRHTENKIQSFRIVPRGETSAEGTGGSIRTSQHSTLLEVAGHSRCRKMFAVQFHERPPGRRQSEVAGSSRSRRSDVAGRSRSRRSEQSQKTLPKNLIARTPKQVSRYKASGSGGLLPRSLCAQRFGTGMNQSNSTGKRWEERTCVSQRERMIWERNI